MKKIVLIIILLMGIKGYSQHPELMDREWNLYYGILNGEVFNPPQGFRSQVDFQINDFSVYHNDCTDAVISSIEYSSDNIFVLNDCIYIVGVCSDPDLNAFMGKHYGIFTLPDFIPKNPFNYTIESDGDTYMLTIENGEGDIAVYGNVALSQPEFSPLQVTLYPNPVSDVLYINSMDIINKVSVYDIQGKVIKTVSGLNSNTSEINLSSLQNGVYFVSITSENGGVLTQKIVKK
jgi:hypothetical protein